jgi:hypothetical protein
MKQFDKNASTYDIINDLVEGQYYANNNSYGYSAGYLSSVLDAVIQNLSDDRNKNNGESVSIGIVNCSGQK